MLRTRRVQFQGGEAQGGTGRVTEYRMSDIAGVSKSLVTDAWTWPVHGLRHPPENGTSGWYVWTGDLQEADDFFLPWHQRHLVERCPAVLPHLQLPPGSRFLIAPGHEDVWFDEALLLDEAPSRIRRATGAILRAALRRRGAGPR